MAHGSRDLKDYDGEKIRVACRLCQRRAQYDKAAMIARVGPDVPLPSLLPRLAAGMGCEMAAAQMKDYNLPGLKRCHLVYSDLVRD